MFKRKFNQVRGSFEFIKDYINFKKQFDNQSEFKTITLFPIVTDRYDTAGIVGGAYFHQDMLVSRRISENQPIKHVDIGSRMDGFIAHVASFREIEVFDIRPNNKIIKNIRFKQMDLMVLDPQLVDYCDSISSLHVIEHFGLGRYGDTMDINGYRKGLENINKILRIGGKFYFSVPIGSQRIEFNAHRVFDVNFLVDLLSKNYVIDCFSYVDDNGDLHENADLGNKRGVDTNYGCRFGCGIFELTKIA